MKTTSYLNQTTSNLLLLIGLVFVLYTLKSLIVPLLLAIIMSVVIFPFQQTLERKLKCNRLVATLISLTVVFSITIILLLTLGSQLHFFIENSNTYGDKIVNVYTDTIKEIESVLQVRSSNSLLREDVKFGALIKENFDVVSAVALGWGSLLSDLILIPIYIFFFLYYRKFFRNFAYRLFSGDSKSYINTMIEKIYTAQRRYIYGLLKVMLIVGTLNSIGLLLLGIENALFFGFFAALLLVVPYVGVIVGALLPALVALATKDSYLYAVGVLALFSFIQFVEGYFITPKVIGGDISVNAFAAIFALLAFAMLWGIAGMILALPITAALKILFDHSTKYAALGFLIGQPEDRYLNNQARQRLKRLKARKNN
ncbi:AI-2E family transporter [Gilvibacter sediminis]|uniref:AI-2E family transporter n=1 Tax=Gilvibacter sediminis TaxID=379071 RepID=UPI002350127E|nr:AI-2E family transporter [Gilvibacter sediminis]MDC7999372.1 AI-2E family transporter [Gilvibacter sediminis]